AYRPRLARGRQITWSIVVARHADLALDAVVADIAAADRADAEVAAHAVRVEVAGADAARVHVAACLRNLHVARRDRAHRHVAGDVADDQAARTHALRVEAAADTADLGVTRCDRTQRHVALDVAQHEIARSDGARVRIAVHAVHAGVAGAEAGKIEAAGIAGHHVTRTHAQAERARDAARLEVAGTERRIQRGDVVDLRIARTFLQLDRQRLRHAHVQLQVCVGAAEQRHQHGAVAVVRDDAGGVAAARRFDLHVLQPFLVRGTRGAAHHDIGQPRLAVEHQIIGTDLDHQRFQARGIDFGIARRAVATLLGAQGRERQRQQRRAREQQDGFAHDFPPACENEVSPGLTAIAMPTGPYSDFDAFQWAGPGPMPGKVSADSAQTPANTGRAALRRGLSVPRPWPDSTARPARPAICPQDFRPSRQPTLPSAGSGARIWHWRGAVPRRNRRARAARGSPARTRRRRSRPAADRVPHPP